MPRADRAGSLPEPPNEHGDGREADIREYHKAFVTRFVMPSMAVMSVLFYATYFSLEADKLLVMGLCLLVILANIYVTSANRLFRLGRWTIKTRSDDLFDAARWTFNLLVADVALALTFKPSPGVFVISWLIIVLSAQADTFQRSHRRPIVALGLVTGAALYRLLYPQSPLDEFLLISSCMVAVVLMAAVTETYWIREIMARQDARRRSELAEVQASQLKRQALIGGHLRTISHELGNLLGVLDLAAHYEEQQIAGRQLEVVRRTVAHAKKISALILADASTTDAVRRYSASDLADDLNLLLAKEVRQRRIEWSLVFDPSVASLSILERGGGTYFVVHNIVKNAWEAIESRAAKAAPAPAGTPLAGVRGRIGISFTRQGNQLELAITDDAGGMSAAQSEAILQGRSVSTKSGGHGLGLRYVLGECQKNGYSLAIESVPGRGTTFRILMPVVA